MVKAGGINDRGCQPNVHKTKHFIPAIAGTSHPAGVGDYPGRLGDGRNRTRCEPMIRKQAEHCKARAETAIRPYTEDLEPNIPFGRQAGCGAACLVKAGGVSQTFTRQNISFPRLREPATRRGLVIIPAVLVTAVTEHPVKPMIRKQAEHCKGRRKQRSAPTQKNL